MRTEKEYFAFISYKEEDYKMAKWLQHKLEHYHLPSVIRKENPELPKRISPIFEYKSEMSGGYLKPSINAALDESKYLIVICSPNAPKSIWVADEVQKFINAGKTDYIIPFIIAGEAYSKDPQEECFPDPLRKLKEPLRGISINELGRDAAAIKVVAQMFGLKFDTLWQRYEREQRKRRWMWGSLALFLALAGLAVALFFNHQNILIKEKDRGMQEALSRAIAEKIHSLVEEGDLYTAQLLALEILPDTDSDSSRPYTPEAEKALHEALEPFEKDGYKQVSVLKGRDGYGGPDNIRMSKLEDVVYFINGGYLFKHYLETGEELQFESNGIKNRFGDFGIFDDTPIYLNKTETKICTIDLPSFTIWDTHSGKILRSGEIDSERINISWDEGGKLLPSLDASFDDSETDNNQELQIDDLPYEIRQHVDDYCYNINRSKSGKYIIADKKVFCRETRRNLQIKRFFEINAEPIEFSKDNKLIAIGDENGQISIIDINSFEVLSILNGTYEQIDYFDFSEDRKKIACLSRDSWDSLSAEFTLFDIKGNVLSRKTIPKAISPSVNWESCQVVLPNKLNDSTVNWSIYDIRKNQLCSKKEYNMTGFKWYDLYAPFWESSNCILFLSHDGTVINKWNYETNSIITSNAAPQYTMGNGGDMIEEIRPIDKDRILLAAIQGDNQVMDRKSLKILYPIKHQYISADSTQEREVDHLYQFIATSRVSQDAKKLYTVSCGGVLRIYDIDTGLMLKLVELPIPSGFLPIPSTSPCVVSYDGRLIAYRANGNETKNYLYLIQLPTLQELINKTKKSLKGRKLTMEERRKYYLN